MSPQPETADTEMDEVVRSLADLLIQAAPLVELVNSPETSHEHRALLRELVGPGEYIELAISLHMMCSWRLWELAHAPDEAARQKLTPVGLTGATFDSKTLRFQRHDESANGEA